VRIAATENPETFEMKRRRDENRVRMRARGEGKGGRDATNRLHRDLVPQNELLDERSRSGDPSAPASRSDGLKEGKNEGRRQIASESSPGLFSFLASQLTLEKVDISRTRPSVSMERNPVIRSGGVAPWISG